MHRSTVFARPTTHDASLSSATYNSITLPVMKSSRSMLHHCRVLIRPREWYFGQNIVGGVYKSVHMSDGRRRGANFGHHVTTPCVLDRFLFTMQHPTPVVQIPLLSPSCRLFSSLTPTSPPFFGMRVRGLRGSTHVLPGTRRDFCIGDWIITKYSRTASASRLSNITLWLLRPSRF